MAVRQLRRALPERKARIGAGGIGGKKFHDRVAGLWLGKLRQEDRAVVGAAQELTEQEFALNGLAFPLIPLLVHKRPRKENSDTSQSLAGAKPANRKLNHRRSEAGVV